MKYETIRSLTLPKIGFGAWTIGGESSPNPTVDPASMTALHSALEIGCAHFDTAEYYAGGHAEELPGRAVVENGVIEYCQQNDILVTAYSPVKFRSIRVNKVLGDVAN